MYFILSVSMVERKKLQMDFRDTLIDTLIHKTFY